MKNIKSGDKLVFKDNESKELFISSNWLNSHFVRDCVQENTCTVHRVEGGLLKISYIKQKPDWCALHSITEQDLKYFYF